MSLNPEAAWSLPSVIQFFSVNRQATSQVYESEWFFLSKLLREGMSVLDIGCAQGGFASILGEHLKSFQYTGLDISQSMITEARKRHPQHHFYVTSDNDYSEIEDHSFDLVICLGILHLNKNWREVIAQAWMKAKTHLLLDLREHAGPTIEDQSKSYFKMNFGEDKNAQEHIPYVVLNSADALMEIKKNCVGYSKLQHFGYEHPVSSSAVTPVKRVMMNSYLIEKTTIPAV